MKFETRFCTSADGTRIAYAVREGTAPPLLVVHGWASLISDWTLEKSALERTRVVYDRRGAGASTRDIDDISLERQVEDVSAIVTALRADTIDIDAFWDGTPIAIAFAAEHPDQIGRMALSGPYIRGTDVISRDALRATMDLAHTNWLMLRRSMRTMGGGSSGAEVQSGMERMRRGISPEMAARYLELYGTMNAESYVDRVSVPTLIVHRPHDGAVTSRAVQEVASRIRDCRLMTSESPEERMEVLRHFFERKDGVDPSPSRAAPAGTRSERSAFRTILFTDIVGHTEMMQRLGDEGGRAILREHERITREALAAHRGIEVKTDGDSFMASFASVSGAVECAVALQRAFAAHSESQGEPIVVRMGLNVGEPIEEGGPDGRVDFFGSAVILGARIKDQAGGGEILVPEAVRHLLAGKSFVFADRGGADLKGFEEPVRLYEVVWR
jgi:class 3 adenylate cyclase